MADAQSFTYRSLNGSLDVPLVIDATGNPVQSPVGSLSPTDVGEYPRDPFGVANPSRPSYWPAGTLSRIVGNLRRTYRIVGGPYIRSARIDFDLFFMDHDVVGSSNDRVEMQWFSGTPVSLTGELIGAAAQLNLTASGGNSLMFPGALFRVITGPDMPAGWAAGIPDQESWGVRTTQIRITGNGLLASSTGAVLILITRRHGLEPSTRAWRVAPLGSSGRSAHGLAS